MSERLRNGLLISADTVALPDVPVRQGALFDPTAHAQLAWCSFAADTPEGYVKLAEMKHGERLRLIDHVNLEVLVEDVYIQPVELTNPETAEVVTAPLILLRSPDGVTYSTCSQGVFGCLADAVLGYGKPPWVGGKRFRVVQKPGKGPHKVLVLLPVAAASQAPRKKGGGNG